MRFDDSLETVLAADVSSPDGASAAWRQLVDLLGRRRAPAREDLLHRLATIRPLVPVAVRAASARALVGAEIPAGLVRFFAEDEPTVAAPVISAARLEAPEWLDMLATMRPTARSILRLRRDLPPEVRAALNSFGATDFVLAGAPGATVAARPPGEQAPVERRDAGDPVVTGGVVKPLPVMAAAPTAAQTGGGTDLPVPAPAQRGPYRIADLVARIEAFRRQRDENGPMLPWPEETVFSGDQPAFRDHAPATRFRFETDQDGVIRWVEGVTRAAVIGTTLSIGTPSAGARVDGVAAGAFRRRASFDNARLLIDGLSDAAGQWRISGVPLFDRASGRFAGYRGVGRRPRADEAAEPISSRAAATADSLRQLVHELRTPTTAIFGFAEMIEAQVLGPVPPVYRDYAGTIRGQTMGLLGAIDDLDMAARIDARALDLRPGEVDFLPLLMRTLVELQPLAALRGAAVMLDHKVGTVAVIGDERAVERLCSRLLAALISAASPGETLTVAVSGDAETGVTVGVSRPRGLMDVSGDALFSIDADADAGLAGAPLLGTGFALRLSRNLAGELGGSLAVEAERLTLRLPAAFNHAMGQASTS